MQRPIDTSDHDLMSRCRQGDAVAFEEIVRRWEQPLGRMVNHLAGAGADVDDLCQEVFVRILRARERYRPSHSFSTWVYRIALNVARDNRRREIRRPQLALDAHDQASAAPTPADAIEAQERSQIVDAAMRALPDALREVLVLKHFGKLSFAEVAEAMDSPLGTVKYRMVAALRELRKELQRRGVTDAE
jgi:RNA polymerase sigma-70 factor (ECF subfamily)